MSEPFIRALKAQQDHVDARFIERHPIAGPHALKWLEDFPSAEPLGRWKVLEGYAAGYNQCLADLKVAMTRERETK